MATEGMPVFGSVMRTGRRGMVLWALALAAVTAIYVAFYPSMGTADMQRAIESMPEALITALGYDQLNTPAGYVSSTVYGLLAPILLLVFGIGTGAALIAGQEEDGTLELSLTAPVGRTRLLIERMAALWTKLLLLVSVVAATALLLVTAMGIDLAVANVLAASAGLYLLVLAFSTIALAVGAATGRRGTALGVAAALAVLAFMLDAIAPLVGAEWMAAVSPFSWFLNGEPLSEGFDPAGSARLALLVAAATLLGIATFPRRDLMV